MTRFAKGVANLRSSQIRDLMSLATRPGIISFAGGMPGNDLFPLQELDTIYNNLTEKEKQVAMQYGPTCGLPSLLESLAAFLEKKGLKVGDNRLMITTGSLQAINILAHAFVDEGDDIIVENPSFIGAISAFKSYQANIISVPLKSDGIDIEALRQQLDSMPRKPKFLYITPSFHNPAGIVYSKENRKALIELMEGRDIPVIEDDAYSDLYFYEEDKEQLKTIQSMERKDLDVCFTGSFSKIIGPGLRLGWMLVPQHIYEKCELIKQSIDACSPSFTQVIADKFLRTDVIHSYLERVREEYKKRGLAMIECLKANLPSYVTFVEPRGGFYIWLQLPEGTDATEILKKAIDKGVVFVSGVTFDPHETRKNAIRVSYCNTAVDVIQKGIPVVCEAIKEVCGQ
ncbi:PLP-dependent aminotransferase family protein [Parabacteroides sp. FAFU027]|uniref:aminotransferase-like domain-containing protein n=1 Tax=Parabacteroides sp. FAFU027 TaxID=2922715 RepID=UPI001FAF02CF|nr:PLP-dependent aminotransferase family protein [Parabacteroides sp. FAFU027]